MVLPRFSLRWIFLATTVFAFFSLVLAQAAQGAAWAIAISLTALAAVVLFLMQAFIFALGRTIYWMTNGLADETSAGQSPFAQSPFTENSASTNLPVKQVVVPPPDPDL